MPFESERDSVLSRELHEYPYLSNDIGDRADWWLPDEFEFLDEIPGTSTGKFDKMALCERFDNGVLDAES